MSEYKCVILVNESLPLGKLANSIAVLSMSIGKKHPEAVGQDLVDGSGSLHSGITTIPIPILKAGDRLNQIREGLKQQEGLTVIDVIDATSTTRSYEDYAEVMKATPSEKLHYYGMALYGPKKLVNQFTGSLGLLR